MTIKRFDFGTEYRGNTGVPGIVGKIDGRYVLYEDYVALKAAQQRGEPDYFTYVINGHHRGIRETMPPDDTYDEGTLVSLYLAPHPAVPDNFERAQSIVSKWPGWKRNYVLVKPAEPTQEPSES